MRIIKIFIISLCFISCKKNIDNNNQSIFLQDYHTLKIGDTLSINIKNDLDVKEWIITNPKTINILYKDEHKITIKAKEKGESKIRIENFDNTISDELNIYVRGKDLIRILAIGNSFSEDAIENNLYDLCKSTNNDIVIGNLYEANSSLENHLKNILNNSEIYNFRKIDVYGNKTNIKNVSINKILNNEKWDYISLQEVSYLSGMEKGIKTNLIPLKNNIEKLNYNKNTQFLLHQTWAYSTTSTHPGFQNYKNDQDLMYNSICKNYKYASSLLGGVKIVPAGTAIQNARIFYSDYDLTRDGYHINLTKGRYILACTWYEILTKKDIRKNPYRYALISNEDNNSIKNIAHLAVLTPEKTSIIPK